ncbi:putative zinc-binding dehydrogenase family oxidoreductase [Thozetella sp. PMI_491]|nr:putative zinc-binding dehydrogenase family oxidoreductase [Thozetella sp. PMI_491]
MGATVPRTAKGNFIRPEIYRLFDDVIESAYSSPLKTNGTSGSEQNGTHGTNGTNGVNGVNGADNGLPKTHSAVVADEVGALVVNPGAQVPDLEDDMVLVRNAAIALNPVDMKMLGPLATAGAVAGHDFAGTVVALGSKVWTAAPIKVGDRVCGAVQGMHSITPRVGAYAQYVGGSDVGIMKIPENMSFEEAATLGTGIGTVGIALFHSLKVPGWPGRPAPEPKTVLVYGGSTATGTLALQILKLAGLDPITTCSPANFDLVKSYGATHAFDYRSKDCVEQIKKHTKNSLKYIIDCVSDPDTMEFCYKCLGRSGGKLTTLEPPPRYLHTREKTVTLDWVLGPALMGKPIAWPPPMQRDADPALREFAKEWFGTIQKLLDQGKLRCHPMKVMEGGLAEIIGGLDMLKKKQVSGQKLVYPLA